MHSIVTSAVGISVALMNDIPPALIILRLTYHALRGREEAGLRPNRAEIAPNRSAQVSNRSDS